MKTSILAAILSTTLLSAASANGAVASPNWLGSGLNLVYDGHANPSCPNLLSGDGQQAGALYSHAPDTDYSPVPLPNGTAVNANQYYCYVVNGNQAVANPVFAPNNFSFVCSTIAPTTDNAPSAALPADGIYTAATSAADFVGSMLNLNVNGAAPVWQPWFRSGDSVVMDVNSQAPQALPTPPHYAPLNALANMPVDPSFHLATTTFTNAAPGPQTVALPAIFGTGDIVELQISNYWVLDPMHPGNPQVTPPAQIQVLAVDAATSLTRCIGEATAGPVNIPQGAGHPRYSTYRIDSSDLLWTDSVKEIELDMSAVPPTSNQWVSVGVVLHGFHEQLLK